MEFHRGHDLRRLCQPYSNGATPYTTSISPGPYSLNGLTLGGQVGSGAGMFNGMLENVQIYNTSLTSSQIGRIYRDGLSGLPLNGSGVSAQLIAWYPLQGNTIDYSGNGNNGTASGLAYAPQQITPALLLSSLNGYGLGFGGAGGKVYALVPQVSTEIGGFDTVAFWMYWNGSAANSPSPFAFGSNALTFNGPCFGFVAGQGGMSGVASSNLANRWVHVAAVFSNGGTNQLYINGVPQSLACGSGSGSGTATPSIFISGTASNSNQYFGGSIADLQIYSSKLTQTQILQLYQSGMPPSASVPASLGWSP